MCYAPRNTKIIYNYTKQNNRELTDNENCDEVIFVLFKQYKEI